MRGTRASLFLAALAIAWLLCAVNAQPNAMAASATNTTANTTSAPTVAGGPLLANHWGQGTTAARPIDFTTGPAATLAFVHLSFGINVWNPQLTVAMFNKPGIKTLFDQSIKNAVPDAVVVSEALPATKGILVRSTVRFQADASGAHAQAEALVKYLTEATLLKQMLPEANWHPVLSYTTFPYLASAVVWPVGPAPGRVPSLHFTLQVQGIRKATFDAKKLAAWKTALKTALPGLTDQGIAAFTTESTELNSRNWYARTDTLVHTQITGPSLPSLRLFSAKLRAKPQAIWSRYTFGAVEAVPRSWVIVALAAPCAKPHCTAYNSWDCNCTACEADWKPSAGGCVEDAAATVYLTFATKDIMPLTAEKKAQLAAVLVDTMAVHPSYTSASAELSVVTSKPGGGRRLQGLTEAWTVIKALFKATKEVTKQMLEKSVKTILSPALVAQGDALPWWKGNMCVSDAAGKCAGPIVKPEATDKSVVWKTTHFGTLHGDPWSVNTAGTSIRFIVEKSKNCGGENDKVQGGTASATVTVGAAPLKFSFFLSGVGELQQTNYDMMTLKLDGKQVAYAHAAGGGQGCVDGPVVVDVPGKWPITLAAGSVHKFEATMTTNDALYHVQSSYHLDLIFQNGGEPVEECAKLTGQTYCIYCGSKRQTCLAEGKPCKAYYMDAGTRKEAVLQLCSLPAFAPRGDPTTATGKCPAFITSGERMYFTVSKLPSEDITECANGPDCSTLPDNRYCVYCGHTLKGDTNTRSYCVGKGGRACSVSLGGNRTPVKLCDTLKAVDSYVVDGECWDSVLHSGAKRSLAYSNVGLPPVDDYVCPWCKVPDTAQPPLPALASGAAPAARIPSPSGLLQDLIAKIDAAIKKAKTLKPEEQAFCKVQESLTALDLLVKGEMTYAAALVAPELVRVLNCYLASDISDHAWAQAELLYKKQCYWGAGDVSEAGVCTDADRAILRTWYWQQTGTLLLAPFDAKTADPVCETAGNGNAFVHAYWNAMLTVGFNADFAKGVTDAHERNVPWNYLGIDSRMDIINNGIGRMIGQRFWDNLSLLKRPGYLLSGVVTREKSDPALARAVMAEVAKGASSQFKYEYKKGYTSTLVRIVRFGGKPQGDPAGNVCDAQNAVFCPTCRLAPTTDTCKIKQP